MTRSGVSSTSVLFCLTIGAQMNLRLPTCVSNIPLRNLRLQFYISTFHTRTKEYSNTTWKSTLIPIQRPQASGASPILTPSIAPILHEPIQIYYSVPKISMKDEESILPIVEFVLCVCGAPTSDSSDENVIILQNMSVGWTVLRSFATHVYNSPFPQSTTALPEPTRHFRRCFEGTPRSLFFVYNMNSLSAHNPSTLTDESSLKSLRLLNDSFYFSYLMTSLTASDKCTFAPASHRTFTEQSKCVPVLQLNLVNTDVSQLNTSAKSCPHLSSSRSTSRESSKYPYNSVKASPKASATSRAEGLDTEHQQGGHGMDIDPQQNLQTDLSGSTGIESNNLLSLQLHSFTQALERILQKTSEIASNIGVMATDNFRNSELIRTPKSVRHSTYEIDQKEEQPYLVNKNTERPRKEYSKTISYQQLLHTVEVPNKPKAYPIIKPISKNLIRKQIATLSKAEVEAQLEEQRRLREERKRLKQSMKIIQSPFANKNKTMPIRSFRDMSEG